MSRTGFTESFIEQAALAWLESAGRRVRKGAEITPGEPATERADYDEVVLSQRLRDAVLLKLIPGELLGSKVRQILEEAQ